VSIFKDAHQKSRIANLVYVLLYGKKITPSKSKFPLHYNLRNHFENLLSNPLPKRTPNGPGGIPKLAKKILQEANSFHEQIIKNAVLLEMTDYNSSKVSLEKKNKYRKKKPNRDKTPNNIRKTQKPARL